MNKRILSLFLAIILVLFSFPTSAFAIVGGTESSSDLILMQQAFSPGNGFQNNHVEEHSIVSPNNIPQVNMIEPKHLSLNSVPSEVNNTTPSALSIREAELSTPADIQRYTVLVLDTSSSSDFVDSEGSVFYTANTAITQVKASAKKFVEDVHAANGTNYVAIVMYRGSRSTIISPFSTDLDSLKASIDELSASSNVRSVATGLQTADTLISAISDPNAIKNVVLFTTGMTNDGTYNYTGHYNENTVGSNWRRSDTQVRLYAYANVAYAAAQTLKSKSTLYTVGLFQTMENMPTEGKEVVQFFKLSALEWATSSNYFYDVKDPNDLEFIFGEIADKLLDSDGDGIPDEWEINGVDIDGVFIDLPAMGANLNIPDIFVEVDWMVEPNQNSLWSETRPETNLAPSEAAMRIVYESFKAKGINLHIDVGPDSLDFVTGRKWGALSGGNQIPYESNFNLGSDYEHWSETRDTNFNNTRASVFKHCLFVNTYNGESSSGIADDIPGQYFIVANQSWLRKTGDTGIAGTFMHELGHTLNLCHGGHTNTGEGDHTPYKPNYLSIMNYSFQTSGLVGTNAVNYSDYKLPDLNEKALNENDGIDPVGLTDGTGLGTKFKRTNLFSSTTREHTIVPVAFTSIDYSGWWGINKNAISVDLNDDGEKSILTSSNDWSNIRYKGGNIGNEKVYMEGISKPSEDKLEALKEPVLKEFIEAGVLGNKGAGAVDGVGPFTIIAGIAGQNFYIRVSNLTTDDETYQLSVEANSLTPAFTTNVSVGASDSDSDWDINYTDVPIPLAINPSVGEYTIVARLSHLDCEDVVRNIPVTVYNPTVEEKKALKDAIKEGELDGLLSENIINQYLDILDNTQSTTYTITATAGTGGTVTGGSSYDSGANITLIATPNSYYTFDGWYESGTRVNGAGSTYTFVATANRTLEARFAYVGGGSTSGGGSYTPTVETVSWSNVQTQINNAKDGDTITVDMKGETTLPVSIINALKGKNATLVLNMSVYSWEIKGKNVVGDISASQVSYDLKVAKITDNSLSKLVDNKDIAILELTHNGAFPFTATLKWNIGVSQAGKRTYISYYNESTKQLEYINEVTADNSGNVKYDFEYASKYVLTTASYGTLKTNPGTGGFNVPSGIYVTHNPNTGVNGGMNTIVPYLIEDGKETLIKWSAVIGNVIAFRTLKDGSYEYRDNKKIFNDTNGHWAADTIDFIISRELFTGMGDGKFDPNGNMTRAMFVTVLSRLDGVGLSAYTTSKFTDVDINEWYGKAVAWAVDKGITSGVGNNQFAPNRAINREEMAVFLYHYMKYKGIELPNTESNIPFADTEKVSDWAKNAVADMKRLGLINGVGSNNYAPKDTANRASVAQIFKNLITAFVGK